MRCGWRFTLAKDWQNTPSRGAQVEKLRIELLDGARRGGRVDELILNVLELLGRELVVVELVEVTDDVRRLGLREHATIEDLLLATLKTLGPALQRPVDRLRTGRQPALQDREREPNRVAALAVRAFAARSIPSRTYVCDLLIQILLKLR